MTIGDLSRHVRRPGAGARGAQTAAALVLGAEDRVEPLLRYEILNRVHASGRQDRLGREVELILSTVEMLDLSAEILSRALQPCPLPVRTLDALHLATLAFIRARGREVVVASYDLRLLAAAKAIGIESIDP